MNTTDRPISVAVIAYDGITPFHLSVPCLVFEAGQGAGQAGFDVRVCAADGTPLRTSAGFAIATDYDLRALDDADIVIMPSWHNDCRAAPPALLDALRAAHARGARVVGLCLGAFPLAEAGLLDGKTATTHWQFAAALAARHPRIDIDPDVLYVDAGQVLTSAGVAAGLDCCLHLLRQLRGADAANRVARQLVIAPHRQGGQAQYIQQPVPATAERDRLAPLLEWLGKHLDVPHELDELARRALMSRRTFTRRFRESTGTTVGQWIQNQRLALAQRLLETTDHPVERVATGAGFGSAVSLRKHFTSAFKVSPTVYRRQFSRTEEAA